jgi:hypothetical protein
MPLKLKSEEIVAALRRSVQSSLRFNAHSLRISYEIERANRNESNGEPKKKAFLCSFSGFLLRHSFFLILRPIIAGFHSPNKKVIAKLLTIPLNLLQVSAHILACLLLHGSTTTNMPKEWKNEPYGNTRDLDKDDE